ncbi:hypothetical protein Vafri_12734, partial [Volvox africanus]
RSTGCRVAPGDADREVRSAKSASRALGEAFPMPAGSSTFHAGSSGQASAPSSGAHVTGAEAGPSWALRSPTCGPGSPEETGDPMRAAPALGAGGGARMDEPRSTTTALLSRPSSAATGDAHSLQTASWPPLAASTPSSLISSSPASDICEVM